MNKSLLALLIVALAYSDCRSQEQKVPVPLTPLIGDTLSRNDRDHFKLFPEVDGFQWAVFTMDADTVVTAKICILRDGNTEFTFVRMGPLPSIRKELAGMQKKESSIRHRPGPLYLAVSLARLPEVATPVQSSRHLSLRLELGFKITPWLAIGTALDGYDQNQSGVFSFLLVLTSPTEFLGFEPYAYYNSRPFAGILKHAEGYDHSLGVGVALPLGGRGFRIRGGGALLITSWKEYTAIYSPDYYFIGYQEETFHRTIGIAELSLVIPL